MLISPTRGEFVFDAVFRTDHTSEIEVTSHPVQYGASITDHSYFQPEEVSFQFGFSDVMGEVGETNHSVNAFAQIKAIMMEREPVTLVTRLWRYDDMLITALSTPDEVGQMYGLKGDMRLRQITIVEASIVQVQTKIKSGKSSGANKKNDATNSTENQLQSELARMRDNGILPAWPWADGKSSTEDKGTHTDNGATLTGP